MTCTLHPRFVCQRETFEIRAKPSYRLMKAPESEQEALKLELEASKSEPEAFSEEKYR